MGHKSQTKTVTVGLHHAKKCLREYADSEGPDQSAHQSDQGLCCPLTESLDTIECISGEKMSR